jgi:hypothetical protein
MIGNIEDYQGACQFRGVFFNLYIGIHYRSSCQDIKGIAFAFTDIKPDFC